MTFKAHIHKIIKKETSNTGMITNIGLFLTASSLIFIWIYRNIFHADGGFFLLFLVSLVGLLTYLFAFIYQYYDFEKIKNIQKGFIEFEKNELIIDYNEKIKYEELTGFDLSINGYYDETINPSYKYPIEKRSLGISNYLAITHNSKIRIFNFKLESKSHLRVLERNIYQIVINEKLRNIDGKKSIKLIPEQYKSYEEYIEYVGKQLKEKKINCTEGLLLIGYKSYEEAQQLRKKYCS